MSTKPIGYSEAPDESISEDFQGEFNSIKTLPNEQIANDKLVQRLQLQLKDKKQSPETGANELGGEKRKLENDVTENIKKIKTTQANDIGVVIPDIDSRAFDKIRHIKLVDSFESTDGEKDIVSEHEEFYEVELAPGNIAAQSDDSDLEEFFEPELTEEELAHLRKEDPAINNEVNENSAKPAQEERASNVHVKAEIELSDQEDEVSNSHYGQSLPELTVPQYVPSDGDLTILKKQVTSQLLGNFANILESESLSEKYKEIQSLFEHTIRDREGHSLLLIGPRSSGKTSIVNKALDDMESKYGEDFLVFKLNAFVHTDDNSALREIAKQLDRRHLKQRNGEDIDSDIENENENGGEGNFEQRSINDTLNNILLSINSSGERIRHEESKSTEHGDDASKPPMIFIIEEFEKFTDDHRQTLLYNLFDASQSSSAPICVVGVSTKIITRELLEKRVRSRFSQRIMSINKPTEIKEFWSNAKLGLKLSNTSLLKLEDKSYGEQWNENIDSLYDQGNILKRLVYQNFYTVKNYKDFNNTCVYPLSKLSPKTPFLRDIDFLKYHQSRSKNHVQELIKSLSTLELLLAIAAARWIERFNLQVINFNLAYKEYEDMMKGFNVNSTSSASSSSTTNLDSKLLTNIKINQKIWSPKVLKNSWEILYKLGLLLDSTGLTTNNDGHIITNVNLNRSLVIEENRMVQLDVSLDELGILIDDSNAFKKLTKL